MKKKNMDWGLGTREKAWLKILAPGLLLIGFSILLAACEDPFPYDSPGPSAPAGKGYFSLKLDEQAAGRTVVPGFSQSEFVTYTLEFFETGTSNPLMSPVGRDYGHLSDPVLLDEGTWDLVVKGYTDPGGTLLAAKGNLDGIIIGSAGVTSGSVTLKPIVAASESGTFSWDIDYPGDVDKVSMRITCASPAYDYTCYFVGGAPFAAKTGSMALDSGYYSVLFTLEKADTQKIEWQEILHVYQNLDSSYVKDFDADLFNNIIYTVTYKYNDGATPDLEDSHEHGDTLTSHSPTWPVPGIDFTFANWYTDDGTFADPWVFSTALTGDITLYAKWTYTVTFNTNGATGTTPSAITQTVGTNITLPGDTGLVFTGCTFFGWNTQTNGKGTNYTTTYAYGGGTKTLYAKWLGDQELDLDLEVEDGSPAGLADITISRTGTLPYNTTAALTVSNASEFDSITWIYNGITLGSGASYTLDSSDIRYNMLGPKLLTVEAVKGTKYYSTSITFTVVD